MSPQRLNSRTAIALALPLALAGVGLGGCAGTPPEDDGGSYGDSGMVDDAGREGGADEDAGDGGTEDAGSGDAAARDAGSRDASSMDSGPDGAAGDGGRMDGGVVDAGGRDGSMSDAGSGDAGSGDAGSGDAGSRDASATDAGSGACASGFACATGCCPYPPTATLTVDDGTDPDLEIDAADVLHLGFRRDQAIHHGRWTGSTWATEVVIPAPGSSNALGDYELAIDPTTDEITIVYADNYAIRFGRWDGAMWRLGDLIELYRVTAAPQGVSFIFDATGRPHVFYMTGTEVHYATRDAGVWSVENVGAPYAGFDSSSLAVDAAGVVHAAYFARRLYYATRSGGTWSHEVVDENGWVRGMYPSLALDTMSRPHISYHDHSEDDLRYARWDGAAWQHEIVDYTSLYRGGSWTVLLLDGADLPVIAHQGWSPRDSVRYSAFDGASWTNSALAVEPRTPSSTNRSFGLLIQMVRDSRGDDHLVYQHSYLRSGPPGWTHEIHYTRR